MKLQINTDVKTITIEEAISLGELYELLNSMFPNFMWKDYLLIPEAKIEYFKDPITIPWNPQPWIQPWNPVVPYTPNPLPWSYPTITCGGVDSTCATNSEDVRVYTTDKIKGGTYNLIIDK